jgi:hypothetical protein
MNSFDTIDDFLLPAIGQVVEYAKFVYAPIEDKTIVFGQRLMIQDFTHSECIADFRFWKEYLQDLSNKLWPRLSPFLGKNMYSLTLENGYTAPYETCLLVYNADHLLIIRCIRWITSLKLVDNALYSASVVLSATSVCNLDAHVIGQPPELKDIPCVRFRRRRVHIRIYSTPVATKIGVHPTLERMVVRAQINPFIFGSSQIFDNALDCQCM